LGVAGGESAEDRSAAETQKHILLVDSYHPAPRLKTRGLFQGPADSGGSAAPRKRIQTQFPERGGAFWAATAA
jgi:hypothetical protein